MKKIVVDMQNFLFGDSIAAAFKNSDYDIDVIRAESPNRTMPSVPTVCPCNGGYRLYTLAVRRKVEIEG